ncbi:LVIVD repeat-containing protein [Halomarina ordinaria]|uniref:LVIVD repeat-containing protein n=1 Tax=Halomarina ordinaria TaxID=3033939 RepID=A0ABD5U7R8_9EURY|nr:hypothetical protein [Halomarina sp. PSRA2]
MVNDGLSRRTALRALGGALALPTLPALPLTGRAAGQDGFAPLGRVEVEGTKEAVVDGDVAYLATTDGFATVDVSDPESPALLAERRDLLADREGGPLEEIFDVKVDGDRLVVPGPANASQGALQGAALYDVADPAAPERLAVYETDFFHHNVYFDDGVLYFGANGLPGNPLVMVDADALAADDPNPELGRWSPAAEDDRWLDVPFGVFNLHDIWVQEGVAALAYWDAGTWLVDVSDPAAPDPIVKVRGYDPEDLAGLSDQAVASRQFQLPGNDHFVAFDDDMSLLGLGMEAWDQTPDDGEGSPGGIDLYDVSTLAAPELVHSFAAPPTDDPSYSGTWTTSHNFELTGGRLYASWYQGGVSVHDVRDPSDPTPLAEWRDEVETSFWTARAARPGEFFVASSANFLEWDVTEALYTFPDPDLEESVPNTTTPTPGGNASNGTDGPTANGSTANGTNGSAANGSGTNETNGSAGSGATGPGVGVLGGAAAFGLGAWRLATRTREE